MKHLYLSEEETKSLKALVRKKFLPAYMSLLVLLIVSFCLVLLKSLQGEMHYFSFAPMAVVLMLALAGILAVSWVWINKSTILLGAGHDKKKIYTGAVSDKRIKESKFYFYMDGNKFRVSEKEYNSFDVGDSIEFHISVKNKFLLKVSKPKSSYSTE